MSNSSIVLLRDDNVSLIVENADKIFSVDDVIKYGSLWTFSFAMSLDIINELLGDDEMHELSSSESDVE